MGAGGSTGLCRRRHLTGCLGNREEEVVTTLGSHDLGAVSPSHLVEGGGATEHLFWRMGPHEPGREGVGAEGCGCKAVACEDGSAGQVIRGRARV